MISIVLPTYNEKEHIQNLIKDLFKHCPPNEEMEIIVVDDNSQDGTPDLVRQVNDPRVKLIHRTKTRGLASAFNRGIIETRGNYVGWMDADMCMPAEMIPRMYAKLQEGQDLVIGSRYADGGKDDRSWVRTSSSKLINWFARFLLGHDIKDCDSGFVLLKREVFDAVTIIPIGYGEYFIEFIYNVCQAGLKVHEIGFHFRDRAEGSSKSFPNVPAFLWTGSMYAWRIIRARLRVRR